MITQNLRHTAFQYFLFLVGIFTISLGIAFSTCSGLGTTPLASFPYALSLGLSPSMGTFMMMLNLACFLGQVLLLRKNFPKLWILQIPAAFVFGWMTDFSNYLLSWLQPSSYGTQLLCLAAGIFFVAAGLSIEVSANTIMLSVDGFVKAVVIATKKNFGIIKVAFDITLVSLSVLCSLLMVGGIEGVREGTVLAALLVGTLSRILTPLLNGYLPKPRSSVSVTLTKKSTSSEISDSKKEVSDGTIV